MTPEQRIARQNAEINARLRRAIVDDELPDVGAIADNPLFSAIPDQKAFVRNAAIAAWMERQSGNTVVPGSAQWQPAKDALVKSFFRQPTAKGVTDEEVAGLVRDHIKTQSTLAEQAFNAAALEMPLSEAIRMAQDKAGIRSPGRLATKAGEYLADFTRQYADTKEKLFPYREQINQLTEMGRGAEKQIAETNIVPWEDMAKVMLTIPAEDREDVLHAIAAQGKQEGETQKDAFTRTAQAFVRGLELEVMKSQDGLRDIGFGALMTLSAAEAAGAQTAGAMAGIDVKGPESFIRSEEEQQMDFLKRQMRDLSRGSLDPLDRVELLGMSISGAAENLPMMAASFIPYVGPAMMLASFKAETEYQLRQQYPEMDSATVEGFSMLAAPVLGASEIISNRLVYGRLPNLARLINAPAFRSGAIVGQLAGRVGIGGAVEYSEEFFQQAFPQVMVDLAEAMGADIPDVNWGDFWRDWKANQGELIATIIPLVLLGSGVGQFSDFQNSRALARDQDLLVAAGYSVENAAKIKEFADAGKWGEAQDLMLKDWRAVNAKGVSIPEVSNEAKTKILAEREEAREKVLEKLQQVQDDVGRIAAQGGYSLSKVAGGWQVTTPDSQVTVASAEEATALLQNHYNEAERENILAVAKLADELEKQGDTQRVEIKPGEQVQIKWEDNQQAVEVAARMAGLTPEQAKRVTFSVLGSNKFEYAEGLKRAVSTIFQGGNVLTMLEETVEGRVKRAFETGALTREEATKMVQLAESIVNEGKTGKDIQTFLVKDAADQDRALIEAISKIVYLDEFGRRKEGGRFTPGLITRGLKAAVQMRAPTEALAFQMQQAAQGKVAEASQMHAFLSAFRTLFGSVFKAARALKQARAQGRTEELDTFINKLIGVQTEMVEQEATVQEAQTLLAEMPQLEGQPYETFAMSPARGIRFDEIAKEDPKYDVSRVGTAWQGKVKPTTQDTNDGIATIDAKELEKQMKMLTHFVDGVPLPKFITELSNPEKRMRAFIDFQKKNLLALYDAFFKLSKDYVVRSTHWYDGARLIAEGIRDKSGVTVEQASAIIAVFSPMKDWFQNVAMGQRFADVMANHKDRKITSAEMGGAMQTMLASTEDEEGIGQIFQQIEGKSITDLLEDRSKEGRKLASVAARLVSQHVHGLYHDVLSPEGESLGVRLNLAKGKKAPERKQLVWQSYTFIEKAISIYEDGSLENISKVLGTEHKIRNFYNNIVAPTSPYGDATVDTHAVNAAVLFPMGNKGYLVGLNFGNAGVAGGGNSGIYWLFHEALREAASERNVMPRQMQSITWEAIRGLFTDVRKRDKNFIATITKIWENAENDDVARSQIIQLGITPPEWARMGGGYSRSAGSLGENQGQAAGSAGGFQSGVRQERDGRDLGAGVEPGSAQRNRTRAGTGTAESGTGTTFSIAQDQFGTRDGRGLEQGGIDTPRASAPLAGAPQIAGIIGPDLQLVEVARSYAKSIGLPFGRQKVYAEVNEKLAERIAQAYDEMQHDPQNPVVAEAYQNLIQQTIAQYQALTKAGYRFWLHDSKTDPYEGKPARAMRDLRNNKSMAVFATESGFGSNATDIDVKDNPLLDDTGIRWPFGSPDGPLKRVLANDLFRAVHDAFGHGLEGAGFRARGEENAWQAHVSLYTGSAIPAITTETRGQNSWLNFGPHGKHNQTASVEETIFADQKTGLMPSFTWTEGRVEHDIETPVSFSLRPSFEDRLTGVFSPLMRDPVVRRELAQRALEKAKSAAAKLGKLKKGEVTPQEQRDRTVAGLRVLNAALAAMPPVVRTRVGGFIAVAQRTTAEGMMREIERRIAKLDVELERYLAEEATQEAEDLFERYKSQRDSGGRQAGKILASGTEQIDYALGIYGLDDEQQDTTIGGLQKRIDDADNADDLADAMNKMAIAELFSHWDKQDSESRYAAVDWMRDIIETGKLGRSIIDEERKQFLAALKEDARTAVLGDVRASLAEAENKDNQTDSSAWQTFVRNVKSAGGSLLWTTAQQIELLFGADSQVYKYFTDKIIEAANLSTDIKTAADKRRVAFMQQLFDTKSSLKLAQAMARLQKARSSGVFVNVGRVVEKMKIPVEVLERLSDGTVTPEDIGLNDAQAQQALEDFAAAGPMKRQIEVEKVVNAGEQVEKFMSEGQGIMWFLWSRQDVSRKQMERDGWNEDSLKQLDAFLSDEAKAIADFIAQDLQMAGDMIDPVYRRLFNAPMPRNKNYAPIYRLKPADTAAMDFEAGMSSGLDAGFTKARVNNSLPLREMDAFVVFLSHWEHVSHWVSHAELMRDMKSVMFDANVQNAIRTKSGKGALEGINNRLKAIESNGNRAAWDLHSVNKIWSNLTKFRAFKGLAFRVSPVVKQTSAFLNPLLADVPAHAYAIGLANAFGDPVNFASDVAAMWESPIIQRRLDGGFSAEARIAMGRAGITGSTLIAAMQKGMMPMAMTDAGWTALGAAISFRYYKKVAMREEGTTEEQANAIAMKRVERMIATSAQPADLVNRALIENQTNPIVKSLWMFASESRKSLAIELMAMRNLAKGKEVGMNIQRILVAHFVQAAVTQLMGSFLMSIMGDDDDKERAWSLDTWALSLALGPINGLFVLGSVIDTAARRAAGMYTFPSELLPGQVYSVTEKAVRNIDDLFQDDPDSVLDEIDKISAAVGTIMSTIFGPAGGAVDVFGNVARDARKIYQSQTED